MVKRRPKRTTPDITVAKTAVEVLIGDLRQISHVWDSWVHLFRNPDAGESTNRYRLMKNPVFVEHFFGMLEEVLIRDVTIGITRVLDTRKDVLGVRTLEEHIVLLDVDQQQPTLELAKTARRIHKPASLVRQHVFGHRNEDFATGVRDISELTIELDDVYRTLSLIVEFVDVFDLKLNGRRREWVMIGEDTVGGLFLVLDEAEQYRAEHPLFPINKEEESQPRHRTDGLV